LVSTNRDIDTTIHPAKTQPLAAVSGSRFLLEVFQISHEESPEQLCVLVFVYVLQVMRKYKD
jgi:hypothetical protein